MTKIDQIFEYIKHQNETFPYFFTLFTCFLLLQSTMKQLYSQPFQGRKNGTSGNTAIQMYLISQLKKLSIKSLLDKRYVYPFACKTDEKHVHAAYVVDGMHIKTLRNILHTTHYNHISSSYLKSWSYFQYALHPGTDDNVSGIALLLFLSNQLNTKDFKKPSTKIEISLSPYFLVKKIDYLEVSIC